MRESTQAKRRAILTAARELFVDQGVDRVSMDAVSAQAKVSKATVYEYFGDKRRLFLAILADAAESLAASMQRALDTHLPDGAAGIATVPQLESALTALAIDIGTTMLGTADYAAVFALVAQQRWQTPGTDDDLATAVPEKALIELITQFTAAGLLDTDNPRRAADHFAALTILLAYNEQPDPSRTDLDRVRRTMVDGVHAFMRAYGTR
ncbi:TetR/AcrR family transcriptional regulator [Dactylosporangium sp. CS-047395]|uniref:TetR/AcrR family transcriptional regulator n=1 Tax=Dactylosporangium sp. CS-047395 TaxID=3239936 RepID=UPI003D8BA051